MRKKSIFLALILIITVIILGACGLQEDGTQPDEEDQVEEQRTETRDEEAEIDLDDEIGDVVDQYEIDEQQLDFPEESEYRSISPFTGVPLENEFFNRAVAVSIENSPEARPQSGLDEAEIIYEFMAEGGVTRFLAIFWPDLPEKIGPIRSARPFLIETAASYDSLFLHAGASPDGFEMLSEEEDIMHLDQIHQSKYFWRSSKRQAPHNLYSGEPALSSYLSNLEEQEYPEQFDFLTASIISDFVKAEEIVIDYWGDYEVLYRYDNSSNNYQRFINDFDNPHQSENGKNLSAKNIIVQYVKTDVKDEEGRLEVDLDSGGKIELFRDGIVVEGSWERNSDYKIDYYDDDGENIQINPGQTWIQVVPRNTEVSY
ncbi:MAG: DUF3048 domain-containing protein [Halanaerobium sp.]